MSHRFGDAGYSYLPACSLLMSIVGISVHYISVDSVQIQLFILRIHYSLGNHLRVAILWFDVLVFVEAEIDTAGADYDGRSAYSGRFEVDSARRGRCSWSLIVGRRWSDICLAARSACVDEQATSLEESRMNMERADL